MDSPRQQSLVHSPRSCASDSFDNNRGAIHKHPLDRAPSISSQQADRLHHLAVGQEYHSAVNWAPSQPTTTLTKAPTDQRPTWHLPTPPRSDSGPPSVSDSKGNSTPRSNSQDDQSASSNMSSLGFLLPSQYGAGNGPYESEPMSYDQNYIPPMRVSQQPRTPGQAPYPQAVSSNPSLYQSRGPQGSEARKASHASTATSDHSYRRISPPYSPHSEYSGQTIPSISGLTQSPPSSVGGSYHSNSSRSPPHYESGYSHSGYTTAPSSGPLYSSAPSYPPGFVGSNMDGKPGSEASMRVINQRPKPQCWDHGCNGRQFSTFSNLLRHQREKSGTASKSYCPRCGAEFTRTTARNGHLAHDKCTKQRHPSDER